MRADFSLQKDDIKISSVVKIWPIIIIVPGLRIGTKHNDPEKI